MIPSPTIQLEERVLILAPVGRDGELARRMLADLEIRAEVCRDVDHMCSEIDRGVGALLITEEVLWDQKVPRLVSVLNDQPSWSAIPTVIAANLDPALFDRTPVLRQFERFKVTFLARPVVVVTLGSTLRAALAARRRQYQVRDLMINLQTELRLRDEFLATLSHELRNPLGAVRNAVQLMNMAELDDPQLRRSREIIDRQSRDLGRLLDDLLEVARITQGKISLSPEIFSLKELLSELVRDMRETGSVSCEIELDLPDDDMVINCDRLRIKQVFLNLIDNADKFSEEGDSIKIRGRTRDAEVVVSVEDQGVGIPKDMLDTVFHLFSQASPSPRTSKGGLGIGLTVVQRLVTMSEGRVEVASDGPGKGTTFTVRLPRAPESATSHVEGYEESHQPERKAYRILLVDDDPDGAQSMCALLKADGHSISVRNDGASGLECARETNPEIIILDIGLPDASGYEIARLLRSDKAFSDTLLIALTGYGSESDRQRAREAGFDRHLTKPIDFAVLRGILRKNNERAA